MHDAFYVVTLDHGITIGRLFLGPVVEFKLDNYGVSVTGCHLRYMEVSNRFSK